MWDMTVEKIAMQELPSCISDRFADHLEKRSVNKWQLFVLREITYKNRLFGDDIFS